MRDDPINGEEDVRPAAVRHPLYNLFSPARYPHPYSMFHDKPGNNVGRDADALGFVNVNAPAQPKPAGEKRILLFGNSAIRAGGFDKSISACLEKQFHNRGQTDVRVYNLGIASAINGQFLMYLVQQGIDLAPDLVITYDGYVDLAIPLTYDPRPGFTYNHYMLEIIHEHLGEGRLHELDFVRAEGERRKQLRQACAWRTEAWEDALVAAYLATLRKIHELAACYGFGAYSCLQPILPGKKEKAGAEKVFRTTTPAYVHLLKMFEKTRQARIELENRFNVPTSRFGDLTGVFADDPEERFVGIIHTTLDAHAVIAERLYNEIEGMV
ncbi:MAG: hypothetical protein HC855_00380 [Rhizobiales bacterium]|nr:hypothetical protein [Hyphomicrobiales bacterium]